MSPLDLAHAKTFIFVPGDRPDRFERAASAGAGVVIIDLEDAVAPERKNEARVFVREWINAGGQALVRVNGIETPWFEQDVRSLPGCAIMLPKCSSADDVQRTIAIAPEPVEIIALVETAAGIGAVREISSTPGVARMAFGHIDFAAELGVEPASREALLLARLSLVYASAEAGLPSPIEGVTTAIRDETQLRSDCDYARGLGFGAKLCIHPAQVAIARAGMGPTAEQVRWAQSVLRASSAGGAQAHDGHMVDEPVLLRASRLLAAAGSQNAEGTDEAAVTSPAAEGS